MKELYVRRMLLTCLLMGLCYKAVEAQPWRLLRSTEEPKQSPAGKSIAIHIPEKKSYPSDPIAGDLNPQILKKILGNDFAPSYVANTKDEAKKKSEHPAEKDFARKMLISSMPDEIKHLDFKMPGTGRHLGPRASKKLQLWLWQNSHCSVINKWKDLGVRYWPRYINVGRCSKKASCSFPKGMSCKLSKTKPVAILRWYCRDMNKARQNTTCKWLKFNYPVTQECQCKCETAPSAT